MLENVARSSDEALAQSYERFLERRGRIRDAARVESLLVATRYPNKPSTYLAATEAHLSALELAVGGLSTEDIERLQAAGIPLLALDWQTQRIGQAATSDAVVIAEVIQRFPSLRPPDGYRSSVRLRVDEVLKGRVDSDTILVRRLSGITARGREMTVRGEFAPVLDKTYMLFLTNNFYDYHLQYPDGRAAAVKVGPADTDPDDWAEDADALDRATAVTQMGVVELDSLDRAHESYYLERYPGLRLEWLSRSAREQVSADVRRVARILQPEMPPSSPAPPAAAPLFPDSNRSEN